MPSPVTVGIIGKTINTGLGTMSFLYKSIFERMATVKNVYIMDSHEINVRDANAANIYVHTWIKNSDIHKLLMFEPVGPTMWAALRYIKTHFPDIELYGIPMIDRIRKNEVQNHNVFNKTLCSTRSTYLILERNGVENLCHVGYGIDTALFYPDQDRINNILNKQDCTFFHNAGWGGDAWRKNTEAVVIAFNKACQRVNTIRLHIHTQKPINQYPANVQKMIKENKKIIVSENNAPFEEIIKMNREADVSILPSKWEGLGIPFYESLACGVPVITVDHFPMNEIIIHNYNGLCCKFTESRMPNNPDSLYLAANVVIDDMVEKICYISDISNRPILYEMSIAARETIIYGQYTVEQLSENLRGAIFGET